MRLQKFLKGKIKQSGKNVGMATCGLCGENKKCFAFLKDTFTDLDQLKTRVFCADCSPLFSAELLKTAFYITEKDVKKIKQHEFESILKTIDLPCVFSFSASRKKHRLFRSRVSTDRRHIFISTDTGEVELNLDKDLKLFDYLSELYNKHKLSKAELSADWNIANVVKIGSDKYFEFLKRTEKYRGTPKYELLINFLNKRNGRQK